MGLSRIELEQNQVAAAVKTTTRVEKNLGNFHESPLTNVA